MERWAEIRRISKVERLSQREIHRRTGVHRDTIRRALASPEPPSYGPRPKRPSKLDPYLVEIERLLENDPRLSGVRIREEIEELGYAGSKKILDDLLRELRPRFLPVATAQGESMVTSLARPCARHRPRVRTRPSAIASKDSASTLT